MLRRLFIFAVLLLMPAVAFSASRGTILEKAYRLYRQGRTDEALALYEKALSRDPDSALLQYGAGTVRAHRGEDALALESLQKAMVAQDRRVEARALYNAGAVQYRIGTNKEKSDPAGAVSALSQSLELFRGAVEKDPSDEDAQFNYELVERALKELKEKQKEQPPQQQKGGQQQEQQSAESQQGSSGSQAPEKPQEQGRQGQEPETGAEPQRSRPQEAQEDAGQSPSGRESSGVESGRFDQGESKNPPAGQETGEMTEDEARMLLDAYRSEEVRGRLRDRARPSPPETFDDW